MTVPNSDAYYIAYSNFHEVITEYDKYKKLGEEKAEFDNIIKDIDVKRKQLKLPDELFDKLHKLLRNSSVFYRNIRDSYCSYLNYWLNEEVRKPYNLEDTSNFDCFYKFAYNFNEVRYGRNQDNACLKYIKYLNGDIYKKMTILYNFYKFYDKLRSSTDSVSNPECKNLLSNVAIYNDVINGYYDKDRDLYDKISSVKVLIEKFLQKPNSNCNESIHFRIPQQILDDQKKKKQEEEEEAERQRRQQQEEKKAERLRRQQQQQQQEVAERQRRQQQEDNRLRQEQFQKRRQRMHTNPDTRREIFQQGEHEFLVGQENSREEVDLGAKQPYEDQLDTRVFKPENEDTNTDGSLLKSLRLPSAITEVLGSVDPVPVVGVSGGMGALFLLFRYTPVGTFFRGGRGRANRIPRSFNGQFLGEFAGYEDYLGGNIGYSQMNPLAE